MKAVWLTSPPRLLPSLPPLSLAGCLFVCGDVLVSLQSFRIFLFFVTRQHASTNATMVFKANCDVHYFHCCSILFKDYFLSCIDWRANSPCFFLCCDLPHPLLSSPLSSALREPTVLTIFRRLVDAWLQCCVVFLFLLHSIEEKKFEKSHLIFFLECLLLSMSVRHFSTILVASLLF